MKPKSPIFVFPFGKSKLQKPVRYVAACLLAGFGFTAHGNLKSSLPADGDCARLQPVEEFIPGPNSNIWDWSMKAEVRKAFDARFKWSNDSCLSTILPGIRHDFMICGDSIWRTAVETHFLRLSDTIPMLYGAGSELSLSVTPRHFATRGRAFHSEYIDGHGESETAGIGRGTLVLPHGDTISNVSLTLHRSRQELVFSMRSHPDVRDLADTTVSRMTRTTETYTWRSAAYSVPLAQTTVATDSVCGQPYGQPRVSAWICPPIYQPLRSMESNVPDAWKTGNGTSPKSRATPSLASLDVSVGDGGISVSGTADADGSIEMLLTDISGRVFASRSPQPCSRGSVVRWSVDRLPAGSYLLYIRQNDDAPYVEKIIIR